MSAGQIDESPGQPRENGLLLRTGDSAGSRLGANRRIAVATPGKRPSAPNWGLRRHPPRGKSTNCRGNPGKTASRSELGTPPAPASGQIDESPGQPRKTASCPELGTPPAPASGQIDKSPGQPREIDSLPRAPAPDQGCSARPHHTTEKRPPQRKVWAARLLLSDVYDTLTGVLSAESV